MGKNVRKSIHTVEYDPCIYTVEYDPCKVNLLHTLNLRASYDTILVM